MVANSPHLPASRLAEFFTLCAASGTLTWKVRPLEHFTCIRSWKRWNTRHAGTIAGSDTKRGYRTVVIELHQYPIHRVIYAMHYGEWPINEIDHINRKRRDNRPVNLRDVTARENMQNSSRWEKG